MRESREGPTSQDAFEALFSAVVAKLQEKGILSKQEAEEVSVETLRRMIEALRRQRLITEADAEAIAADAFDIIRPPTLPDLLGGPRRTSTAQLQALNALQHVLVRASLPVYFLPKPRG